MPVHDLFGAVINDRYRIISCIGAGGMGTVYAAERIVDGRRVALKILLPELCVRKSFVERFFREAQAVSAIKHVGIVEVLDVGTTPRGIAFYVMELLHGEDLAQTLRREGQLSWSRVRNIGMQLCGVLAAAHDKGIIHRDLKPANLFLVRTPDGAEHIKLLDFGAAKLVGVDALSYATLSAAGEIFGTIAYMSPEQAGGHPIDHRTDIYATGVILYQLLTGVVPFTGNSPQQVIRAIMLEEPPPMCAMAPDTEIPAEAESVVRCALQRDPSERFSNIRALGNALLAVSDAQDAERPEPVPVPEILVASSAWPPSIIATGMVDDAKYVDTGVFHQPGETIPDDPNDSLLAGSRSSRLTIWLIVLAGLVTLAGLAAWAYFLGTTPVTARGRV